MENLKRNAERKFNFNQERWNDKKSTETVKRLLAEFNETKILQFGGVNEFRFFVLIFNLNIL